MQICRSRSTGLQAGTDMQRHRHADRQTQTDLGMDLFQGRAPLIARPGGLPARARAGAEVWRQNLPPGNLHVWS